MQFYYIFYRQLYMFRNHQEHTQTVITTSGTGSNRICYRPLTWWSCDSSTSTDGSKYGSTSARCCNYSLNVLLMMDEGVIRNI